LDVALVDRVGAEELRDGVNFLGDLGELFLRGGALGLLLLGAEAGLALEIGESRGEVGQREGLGIVGAEELAADLGEVCLMLALVDCVVELLLEVEELGLLEVGVELDPLWNDSMFRSGQPMNRLYTPLSWLFEFEILK